MTTAIPTSDNVSGEANNAWLLMLLDPNRDTPYVEPYSQFKQRMRAGLAATSALPQPANTAPSNTPGSAAVGTSARYARQDHDHGITPGSGGGGGGTTVAPHTGATGDTDLTGITIGNTDYEIVDTVARADAQAAGQRANQNLASIGNIGLDLSGQTLTLLKNGNGQAAVTLPSSGGDSTVAGLLLTPVGTSNTLTSTAANVPSADTGNVTREDLSDVFFVHAKYTRTNENLHMSGFVLKSDLAGTAEYRFQVQGAGGDYFAFQFDGAGDSANLTVENDSSSVSAAVLRFFNTQPAPSSGGGSVTFGDATEADTASGSGGSGTNAARDDHSHEQSDIYATAAAAREGLFELSSATDNDIADTLRLAERNSNVIKKGVKYYVSGGDAGGLKGKVIRRNGTALPGSVNEATFRANFSTYWETILDTPAAGGGPTITWLKPSAAQDATSNSRPARTVWAVGADMRTALGNIASPSDGDQAFAYLLRTSSTDFALFWIYGDSRWQLVGEANLDSYRAGNIPISGEGTLDGNGISAWSADRSWAEGMLVLYGLSIWEALEDIAAGQAAPGTHHLWAAVTPIISGISDASTANVHAALRLNHGGVVEDIALDPSPAIKIGNISRPVGATFPNDLSIDWDNGRIVTPTTIVADLEFTEQPDHVVVEVQALIAGGGGTAPEVRMALFDETATQASNFETLIPDEEVRYYEFEVTRNSDTYTLEAENVTDGSDSGLITLHSIDILGFTGTSKAARLMATISDKLINLDKELNVSLTTQDVIDQINALVPPAQRVPALADHGGEAVTVKGDESGLEFAKLPSSDTLARVTQGIELATGGTWERVTNADDVAWAAFPSGIPTLEQAKALTFGTDTIFIPDAHVVVTRLKRARHSHQVRINYTARTPGGESGTYGVNGGLLAGSDGGYDYWYKELIFSHAGFDVFGEYNSATDLWLGDLTRQAVYENLKDILKGSGVAFDDSAETVTFT